MEELSGLVSKTITQVIRFSTSQDLRQTCFTSLNVKNSFEAEKVICEKLIEWKPIQICGIRNVVSENPMLECEVINFLNSSYQIETLDV